MPPVLNLNSLGKGRVTRQREKQSRVAFGIARAIVIVFVLAWIVIGIRQWFVLSRWTQRYELYKELQKKIDEKLDYDKDEDNAGSEPS